MFVSAYQNTLDTNKPCRQATLMRKKYIKYAVLKTLGDNLYTTLPKTCLVFYLVYVWLHAALACIDRMK